MKAEDEARVREIFHEEINAMIGSIRNTVTVTLDASDLIHRVEELLEDEETEPWKDNS